MTRSERIQQVQKSLRDFHETRFRNDDQRRQIEYSQGLVAAPSLTERVEPPQRVKKERREERGQEVFPNISVNDRGRWRDR